MLCGLKALTHFNDVHTLESCVTVEKTGVDTNVCIKQKSMKLLYFLWIYGYNYRSFNTGYRPKQ